MLRQSWGSSVAMRRRNVMVIEAKEKVILLLGLLCIVLNIITGVFLYPLNFNITNFYLL